MSEEEKKESSGILDIIKKLIKMLNKLLNGGDRQHGKGSGGHRRRTSSEESK
jgi:hypothetical protein